MSYRRAAPFPNVVIDDFCPPELLDLCLAEFDVLDRDRARRFDRDQERLKTQFNPDAMGPKCRTLFAAFNSLPFIKVLENITGIRGVVPDPYFLGAGLHEVSQGGYLSVHADFNHHRPMNLQRRINVLIYLNRGWEADYGGRLELWDRDMRQCVRSVLPLFNRCVIFNTDSYSYHGNPEPVAHPGGVARRSIALYYYTATWSDALRAHTTAFKARPGSPDKSPSAIAPRELMADLLPPVLTRALRRLRGGRRT